MAVLFLSFVLINFKVFVVVSMAVHGCPIPIIFEKRKKKKKELNCKLDEQ